MKNLTNELEELGLTEKEAKAYVTLSRHGTHPTSYIAKKAKLNRGTAYLALHGLLEKGLVSKSTKKNIQYFSPLSPDSIKHYIKNQRDKLDSQLKNSDDLVSELMSLVSPFANKPKVQFLEGIEGVRLALMNVLDAEDKTIRSFLNILDVAKFIGAEFLEEFTNQRIKRGPALKVLRNPVKDEQAISTNPYAHKYFTNPADRREMRYLDQSVAFPMSIYLYDKKVLGISSRDEGYAVVIESHDLNSTLTMIFDILWPISTKA